MARKRNYRILMGDRVQLKSANVDHGMRARIGTVGVSLRSCRICQVTWDGRKTFDIVKWEQLIRREASDGDNG